MPLTKELERQAKEDIYKSIDSIIERYLSEGVNIYDLQRYFKIEKSFKNLLSDINYAGRRFFGDDEDYPSYVKKVLNVALLDKKSEIETVSLSENKIIKFNQFLNEAIELNGDDLNVEYLFTDVEYSEDDKDILASYFNTKKEYIDSKNSKYSVYSVTDFQTDVLKNNRTTLDVMILTDHQIDKIKENVIKKIVSGLLSKIPNEVEYMNLKIKSHTLLDKGKLKESIEKIIQPQDVINLLTKISGYKYDKKYGDEHHIWKKGN